MGNSHRAKDKGLRGARPVVEPITLRLDAALLSHLAYGRLTDLVTEELGNVPAEEYVVQEANLCLTLFAAVQPFIKQAGTSAYLDVTFTPVSE